jgi:hypothetical protein
MADRMKAKIRAHILSITRSATEPRVVVDIIHEMIRSIQEMIQSLAAIESNREEMVLTR